MQACETSGVAASEMAIVDIFTRLIFGEKDQFDDGELLIIEALRLVETGVARDSHLEMGHYLRALGVAEMIQLVGRVQACLAGSLQPPRADGAMNCALQGQGRFRGGTILDRRAH